MTTETGNPGERVSRVIFDYAARIGKEQDTDALLSLNADMARDLVDAERCSIWLIDSEARELHTRVAHGVGEIRVALDHGLVGACVSQGEPVVANDVAGDSRFSGRVDQATGFVTSSVLVIPMRTAGGKIIGAFQALNKAGGFTGADVSLLGLAASYSAAAIETQRLRQEAETARMFLRELEIARDVQAKLVPQEPPALDNLECATFFRPAKLVGGDYYDLIRTPGGSLAFTLGDVSGKGIPAAVLMASIQASLRIPLSGGPGSLVDLASRLNESVYATSTSTRYSTLFCGLIDAAGQTLTYVNAGQCSPLILRRAEPASIERLTASGVPIGLLPAASYTQDAVTLHPGDVLVCFSDGISEAANEKGEMWQDTEIDDILLRSRDFSPQEITQRIVEAADAYAGEAEQADDMTIVTVRVK
ncbi:MAG: SpoIIE family protein phosphatase [Bryobacterales bacterium]|nr:SpoIIE family protein phosphatase [Bryobacterales bacterium]